MGRACRAGDRRERSPALGGRLRRGGEHPSGQATTALGVLPLSCPPLAFRNKERWDMEPSAGGGACLGSRFRALGVFFPAESVKEGKAGERLGPSLR